MPPGVLAAAPWGRHRPSLLATLRAQARPHRNRRLSANAPSTRSPTHISTPALRTDLTSPFHFPFSTARFSQLTAHRALEPRARSARPLYCRLHRHHPSAPLGPSRARAGGRRGAERAPHRPGSPLRPSRAHAGGRHSTARAPAPMRPAGGAVAPLGAARAAPGGAPSGGLGATFSTPTGGRWARRSCHPRPGVRAVRTKRSVAASTFVVLPIQIRGRRVGLVAPSAGRRGHARRRDIGPMRKEGVGPRVIEPEPAPTYQLPGAGVRGPAFSGSAPRGK